MDRYRPTARPGCLQTVRCRNVGDAVLEIGSSVLHRSEHPIPSDYECNFPGEEGHLRRRQRSRAGPLPISIHEGPGFLRIQCFRPIIQKLVTFDYSRVGCRHLAISEIKETPTKGVSPSITPALFEPRYKPDPRIGARRVGLVKLERDLLKAIGCNRSSCRIEFSRVDAGFLENLFVVKEHAGIGVGRNGVNFLLITYFLPWSLGVFLAEVFSFLLD